MVTFAYLSQVEGGAASSGQGCQPRDNSRMKLPASHFKGHRGQSKDFCAEHDDMSLMSKKYCAGIETRRYIALRLKWVDPLCWNVIATTTKVAEGC